MTTILDAAQRHIDGRWRGADMAKPFAREVIALVKALETISTKHPGDCPAAASYVDFLHRHIADLRKIAHDAAAKAKE